MTTLREAAQQALEAWDGGDTEWFKRAYTVMENLRAALAEPVHETGVKLKPVFYSSKRLTNEELDAALQRLTDVHQDIEATHNIK